MAVLSEARRAVWAAIDNWPELANVFRCRLTWEQDQPLIVEAEPSIRDFPMVEVVPSSGVSPSWRTNVDQNFPYGVEIKVWTQGWSLPQCEDLAERIARALFQSAGSDGVPHIKRAIGAYPVLGGLSITPIRLADTEGDDEDRVTATLLRMQVSLPAKFKPFG